MARHHGATVIEDEAIAALRAFVTNNKNVNPDGFFMETSKLRDVIEGMTDITPDLRTRVLNTLEAEAIRGARFVSTIQLATAFGHMYSTFAHEPGYAEIKAATEDDNKLPLLTLRQQRMIA